MVPERYLKIVFPEGGEAEHGPLNEFIRYGGPKVYVIDADGEVEARIMGIQGAHVVMGDNQFFETHLQVIAKLEFPEGEGE